MTSSSFKAIKTDILLISSKKNVPLTAFEVHNLKWHSNTRRLYIPLTALCVYCSHQPVSDQSPFLSSAGWSVCVRSLKRCCSTAWRRAEAWPSPLLLSSRPRASAARPKQVTTTWPAGLSSARSKVENQGNNFNLASSLYPVQKRPESANLGFSVSVCGGQHTCCCLDLLQFYTTIYNDSGSVYKLWIHYF